LTETERNISLRAEGCWLQNGLIGYYDFRDSLFRNISPSSLNINVEVAERKEFNRQKVNDQLKQLLDEYQINIPKDTKLTFTIDPNNYKLTVSGTDDIVLSGQLEEALNTANNAKELFVHIMDYYGSQLSDLAKNGFDSIPDLFLSIGYENGSLQDIGQKESYGTGKTDWIEELKARVDSLK